MTDPMRTRDAADRPADLASSQSLLSGMIVGRSHQIRRVRARTLQLSQSNIPVLIEGPTGCGKELVAQALHVCSGRSGELIPVNVAAIPETMFEDALYGHAKGAFTGASDDTAGYLVEANQGTLFLDEIGSLPLTMQPKLLRAVETREFRPVGGRRDRRSDFRLVCATNEEMCVGVRSGRFRADLAFRLRGAVIVVPPLADRLEDLPDLARYFLRQAALERHGDVDLQALEINDGCLRLLASYPWPGNVRELKNVIELSAVLAGGARVSECDVAEALHDAVGRPWREGSRESPAAVGQERILNALVRSDWNTEIAAADLGIHRSHLYREMHRVGILPPRKARRAEYLTDAHHAMGAEREIEP